MPTFSVHQAKTHLSIILTMLESGGEVIISRYGKPVARIVPYTIPKTNRKPGLLKGEFDFNDSFFDELPEEELSAWRE